MRLLRISHCAVRCKTQVVGTTTIDGSEGLRFFLALIARANLAIDLRQLKQVLKANKHYKMVAEAWKEIETEFAEGSYGVAAVIQLFCYEYDVDVCVHAHDSDLQWPKHAKHFFRLFVKHVGKPRYSKRCMV